MAEKVLSNELTPIDEAPPPPLADVEAPGDEEADDADDVEAGEGVVVAAGVPEEHAAITNAAVTATVSAFTTD
jgi:hypothetical protein